MLAWRPRNAPGLLATRLGARPSQLLATHTSGSGPQTLVDHVARRLATGKVRMALVSGAELMRTRRVAKKAGISLDWDLGGSGAPEFIIDERLGSSTLEMSHGLVLPTAVFALIENAYRERRGWSVEEHRQRLGKLCAGFNAVAVDNPHSWFPKGRTAEEIVTVGPENRMIAYPYTKYMCAVMDVDQAASLLLTTVGHARELSIPEERWVYYLGGSSVTEEPWNLSERGEIASSPSLRAAGQTALRRAGIGLEDVDFLDLYSCFPSAAQIAGDMLGIPEDDPRPRTVTGGLAYFGGPGSNYTAHAIATLVEKLRAHPGSRGLVTGCGWWLTRNAVGIYASAPPGSGADLEAPEVAWKRQPVRKLAPQPSGPGTIEAYTTLFDHSGAPVRGVVVGSTAAGERFVANTPDDRALLESLIGQDLVGQPGTLHHSDPLNRFEPA